MILNSYNAFYYTSMFILPGLIMKKIFFSLFPINKEAENNSIVVYLLFGAINYLAVSLFTKIALFNCTNDTISYIYLIHSYL